MRHPLSVLRSRAALVTIALLALALPGLARTQRTLSFAERVRAQEAIERVYYSHQIGATAPFDEAVPQSLIEKKVRSYLKESAVLQRLWNTSLSAEELRAEVERIAAQTRMPEALTELYEALNSDPFLVQECLARPALVHRLASGFFAFDSRVHASELREAAAIRDQLQSGLLDPEAPHPNRRYFGLADSGPSEAALEIGPLRQQRDAYIVSLTRIEGGERVIVASYEVDKTTWDVWWESQEGNLDEAAVEPIAASLEVLPPPSVGAADPEPDDPGLDEETAALALDVAIDADGDGHSSDVDCDDTRATVYPGAPQVCDELNNDCADPDWPTVPESEIDNHLYPDADGDGAGSLCDCNDNDSSAYPGCAEICDGRDNDCDGLTDVDTPGLNAFCDTGELGFCAAGVSLCTNGIPECHRISTPSPERCDGLDTDCDGELAWFEKDEDGDGWGPTSLGSGCPMICIDPLQHHCTADCDDHNPNVYPYAPETCGDGVINDCVLALRQLPGLGMCIYYSWNEGDCDRDGWTQCQGDCGPLDPAIHPGATDVCDGKDNNCNGWSEEADYDHDGYAICRGDCDDHDPAVHPGLPETCDGRDNNCDGITPADELDADHDGFSVCGGDCNDQDGAIRPNVPEVCDGKDNNCDGILMIGGESDVDGDSYRTCAMLYCIDPYRRWCTGDCDDLNNAVHPYAQEVCGDGVINDCVDRLRWDHGSACRPGGVIWNEFDCDSDGSTICQGDCLEGDFSTGPRRPEVCDGRDNNCDGVVDGDADLDGFTVCQGDCDDANGAIHPGAIDIPGDPWDQDCSGGPTCDPMASWSGHGAYVSCVDIACQALKKAGLLTGKQCDAIVGTAARSQWVGP